jgi:hypothetical protein
MSPAWHETAVVCCHAQMARHDSQLARGEPASHLAGLDVLVPEIVL